MKNNKLKKLENLKLRTSTFGLRNKLSIIAIVCLLIFAGYSGVNATIKLGNDGTTDWSMVDSDKIRNSNGKSFPATGTGLQDAIWDLNSTGGKIECPDMNITISEFTFGADNIAIRGNGHSSKINIDSTVDVNGFFVERRKNITFDSLFFDGHNDGVWHTSAINCNMSDNIMIKNCIFKDCNSGAIEFEYTSNSTITYNTFDHSTLSAITVWRANATNNIVSNNHFVNCGSMIYMDGCHNIVIDSNTGDVRNAQYGIRVTGNSQIVVISNNEIHGNSSSLDLLRLDGDNVTVIGNILDTTGGNCTKIQGTPTVKNMVIANNIMSNAGYYGIWSYATNNILINSNDISTCAQYGIKVRGENISVTNCEISDCIRGIDLSYSPYSIVIGNRVLDCSTKGIALQGASNYSIVSNNIIRLDSATADGIYIYGTYNCTLIGNVCTDCDYGIMEQGSGNYNIFLGNNCIGCLQGNSILKTGANSVEEHNIE